MAEPLEWLSSVGHWIQENWPWLAGTGAALTAFGAWLHKKLLGDFVTNSMMETCKIEIINKIETSDRKTAQQISEANQENADQHQNILSTVAHAIAELTSAVIGERR